MNVDKNLLPLVVAGNMSMESIAQPVKGTFGMSKCLGFVKTVG